uniref:Zinc metalloproteinase n=1 Tax=Haemonchus contortus TaxID=6289 RepID=A0A7I4YBJ7_HAECO|nr:Peptidase M12A domain containing protein [Haemonchus contortus]
MRFKLLVWLLVAAVNGNISISDGPFSEKVSKISDMIKGKHDDVLKTLDVNRGKIDSLLQELPEIEYDRINHMGDSLYEVNEKSNVDDKLFQSDIVLTETQAQVVINDINEQVGGPNRTKRQALADQNGVQLWKDGVNYYFSPSIDSKTKRAFMMGADMWSKYSCIDFKHNPYAKDRVKIVYEDGCWSSLGKTGGEQKISLGEGCGVGPIVAHEIGHTIGFWHTMARYDRDQFITLNLGNIKQSWLSQFAKQTPQTNDNFNLTYDYGSIMHYGGRSAAIDRKTPTLVPFNTDYQETLGSHFMSFIDLEMINELYGCKKNCAGKRKAQCKMGGFPNPKDCSKCVCPGGYAGDLCTERPDEGCGRKIDATEEWQTLTDVLGDYSVRQPLEDFKKCHYWIESPTGTEILVEIVSLKGHQAVDGCVYTGVEIKTNKNQQLTGFRFCAYQTAGTRLRSFTNRVPIMTWNKVFRSETVLSFRHVPASNARQPQPSSRTVQPSPSRVVQPSPRPTTRSPWSARTPSSTVPTRTRITCSKRVDSRCLSFIKMGFCTDPRMLHYCPKECRIVC